MKGTFENGTGLITSNHLVRWTDLHKREAEQTFPELVRRLLDATPEASEISMRAGDSVALSGYDGTAVLTEGNNLLPPGKIVFELGTDKGIKRKASADFEKRRLEGATDATFIFATPRKWQGKDNWATERRSEKVFKNVWALDADDFEHWLQLAPTVQIWFAEHLGIDLQGAQTLSAWWTRFSESTEPALPKPLYTAGRHGEADQLREFVEGKVGQLVIESTSSDDILGFLAAVLDHDNWNELQDPVIVESEASWRHICSLPGPGILIPTFSSPDVRLAINSGKHVIIPKDSSKSRMHMPEIFLPRVNRPSAEAVLVSAGFRTEEARKLAVIARRSLPAFKRRVSLVPEERSAVWADPSSVSVLCGLFVAGRWCESAGDLGVLEELTGLNNAEIATQLSHFKAGADPVLWNSGEMWSFVCAEEAFVELSPRFNFHSQETWVSIATKVLCEPDPLEGMDPIQRAICGKRGRTYSSQLRRGVAESLAISASAIDGNRESFVRTTIPDRVVSEILRRVQDPADRLSWLGIRDILPVLAEASPNIFLRALEDDLANDRPTVESLFEEVQDELGLRATANYPTLLWALEVVSWNPDFIARSIRVFAQLAIFPVPANLTNTPLASMESILCGWLPRNQLDNGMRRDLLDACFRISPDTARALLKKLWPSRGSIVTPPYRPRYRDWLISSSNVTYGEWFDFVDLLADRVIAWATDEPSYLSWMMEAIETVRSIEASNKLIDYLVARVTANNFSDSTRLDLLTSVSATVGKHKRHRGSDWAMPDELINRLTDLQSLLDPVGLYSQTLLVFEWRPMFSEVDHSDSGYHQKLDQKRSNAVEKILAAPNGWDVLEEITKRVEHAGGVGKAIPFEEELRTLNRLARWLESKDEKLESAARVWVDSWMESKGPATVNTILSQESLSGEARRQLVHCIPRSVEYWDALAKWPEEHSEYWRHGLFDRLNVEHLNRAIQELLRCGRGSTAAVVVAHALHSHERDGIDEGIVISSLRGAISARDDLQRLEPYQIGEILNYLESRSVGQDVLASLEYSFSTWLDDFHEPQALNQILATQPNIFVQIVCQAYRGRNEEGAEPVQELNLSQAQAALSVLDNWNGFPGRADDGSVDPQVFKQWVAEAREMLRESGRAEIGDQMIGMTFVNAPKGADGIWPAEPIRDLIEERSSTHIETGMILGQLNSRGVTSRGIYDGGAQERDLASRYLEDSRSIEIRWPRTATILRDIGQQYERDAAREDEQAEAAQDFD